MNLKPTEIHYKLDGILGEYENLHVIERENEDGRYIKIKIEDCIWRTIPETIRLLEEVIKILKK